LIIFNIDNYNIIIILDDHVFGGLWYPVFGWKFWKNLCKLCRVIYAVMEGKGQEHELVFDVALYVIADLV